MSRARTKRLPENPTHRWSLFSERLGSLSPSAYALLSDWGFLWTAEAVLDGPERPLPEGVYRKDAAGFLLTPLYTSCILKVWILLFDDSGGSISLMRIAKAVGNKKDEDFGTLVRSKATENLKNRSFEEMLSELTDCTRSLKEFANHFSADRNSFAAHVLESASKAKTDPVQLLTLAKVVPKTIYLVELIVPLFGLSPMYLDNILNMRCETAATLFGLREVPEAPKRIFENRGLPFAKFEAAVTAILQANK
jgi:hypothetical protein